MALEVNPHVTRLRRFQPFQPDSAELIYEQSDPNEQMYEMRALAYISEVLADPTVRLLILTGDAGHGKTTLCARLLMGFGMTAREAADAINARGDASTPVAQTGDGRSVWLQKDLSDLTDVGGDQATPVLRRLLNLPDGNVGIVCANEGRLRAAVSQDDSLELAVITKTLELGITDGSVSGVSPTVHVLNLNYQSVAPEGHEGLVDWAFKTWAVDGRRWTICNRCNAKSICPILDNHEALSDRAQGSRRLDAVRELFSTTERAGAVVTTRQALALVAHAVTGGLACPDVHRHSNRSPTDMSWQYPYLYHQALFGDVLSKQQRRQVPPFEKLRSLDPAKVANRFVDDTLDPVEARANFLPPTPSLEDGTPRSRRDAQRESDAIRQLIAFLRRLTYFDAEINQRIERMGLRAGRHFVATTKEGRGTSVKVRDTLLRGLEAVQGVYRRSDVPDFLVLDPAFLSNRSRAAVIALKLTGRDALLVSQKEHWKQDLESTPRLPTTLDWSSRFVVLRLGAEDSSVALDLDLMRFELLFRWAEGLSSRVQHEPEIRSITATLAALVPEGSSSHEIDILVGTERHTLTIDVGDQIRSGGV